MTNEKLDQYYVRKIRELGIQDQYFLERLIYKASLSDLKHLAKEQDSRSRLAREVIKVFYQEVFGDDK